MITTTTPSLEGRQITAYLDIVSAESVQGVHVIRAADAVELRRLLSSPEIVRVVRHAGPSAADELDDLLTAIHALVEHRTATLRGEDGGYGHKG